MKKVKVLMIKTASGPKTSYLSGKKYFIDYETAKEWVKKPNPACKILNVDNPKLKVMDKLAPTKIDFNWINHINFGSFKKAPVIKKPSPKYVPGKRK